MATLHGVVAQAMELGDTLADPEKVLQEKMERLAEMEAEVKRHEEELVELREKFDE